jgi:hypothetical protein
MKAHCLSPLNKKRNEKGKRKIGIKLSQENRMTFGDR